MDSYTRSTSQPKNGGCYSFPSLKVSEILQCMSDLQIPFTEADLMQPTMQRVVPIYEAFLEIFVGVGRESQPSFAALEILEFPDLHQEAISILGFQRQLRKLMCGVGMEDFGIRDIVRPESPRLRRIISAVINFAKFREERSTKMGEFGR
ncbi:kinetochore protein Nuf2, partial [Blyttiomyces helicus]